MIFHASIPADEPERVARVIAEIWRGQYFPFVVPGTFIALSGDDRGTELEVGPRGIEVTPGPSEMGFQRNPSPSQYSEVHVNMATDLSFEELAAIGAREGWITRLCDRGGAFKVIEFWLENRFMLELMTPAELLRYRAVMQAAVWKNMRRPTPTQ